MNGGRRGGAEPPLFRWPEPTPPTLGVWISHTIGWLRLPPCGHRQVEHISDADVALVTGEPNDIARANGRVVVALVASGAESSASVVRALDAGADRCLVGATSGELVAILDSLARRIGPVSER